eukprot:628015_1
MSTNTNKRVQDCWQCELCQTINRIKLTIRKYDFKCYGCKTVTYIEGKTPTIQTSLWNRPGESILPFQEEVEEQCNRFPKDMNATIKSMDPHNTLLMTGYFRSNALKKYNLVMPSAVIDYCIIYLFLFEDLFIGNFHERTNDHKHRWKAFISTSKYKLVKPESIKQVTYDIHPSYKTSTITVTEAPFCLQRRSRGPFEVKATIEFKDEYNRKTIIYTHDLNFKYAVTLTHIEDDKTAKAKEGYEYFLKDDGIHYRNAKKFVRK